MDNMENVSTGASGQSDQTANSSDSLSENKAGAGDEMALASQNADAGESLESSDNGEQEEEFVKDEEGNEYLSKDKVEAIIQKRLSKLSQQKNDARTSLIEALRNDPAAKEEFLNALGLKDSHSEDALGQEANKTQSDQPTKFQKWLAPMPPQHQAHYTGLVESIAEQFEEYVQAELDKRVGPIMSHIGESKVNEFKNSNKDYPKYANEIEKLIQSGRAKTLGDAYIIASYEDKIKNVSAVSTKKQEQAVKKLNSMPTRTPTSGLNTVGTASSLQDAIRKAAEKVGYR